MKILKKLFGCGIIIIVLALTGYVMINNMGLVDGLDFGAGAYYYADMPGFESIVNTDAYISPVPMWVLIVLFLAWGYLMYKLWCYIDKN